MKNRKIAPVVRKRGLYEPDTDVVYWRGQSYQARISALEEIRQEYHHWKNDVQPGLQRVYRIVDFLDLENLKKNKRSSGRLQDLADLEKLEGK